MQRAARQRGSPRSAPRRGRALAGRAAGGAADGERELALQAREQPSQQRSRLSRHPRSAGTLLDIQLPDDPQLGALDGHVCLVEQGRHPAADGVRRRRARQASPPATSAARRRRSARRRRRRARPGHGPGSAVQAARSAVRRAPRAGARRAPGRGWRSRPRRDTRGEAGWRARRSTARPAAGCAAALRGSLGQAGGARAPAVGRKTRRRDAARGGERAQRLRVQQDPCSEAPAELAQLRPPSAVIEQRCPRAVEQGEVDVRAVARFDGIQQRREAGARPVRDGRSREHLLEHDARSALARPSAPAHGHLELVGGVLGEEALGPTPASASARIACWRTARLRRCCVQRERQSAPACPAPVELVLEAGRDGTPNSRPARAAPCAERPRAALPRAPVRLDDVAEHELQRGSLERPRRGPVGARVGQQAQVAQSSQTGWARRAAPAA